MSKVKTQKQQIEEDKENMRLFVVGLELEARANKASYEKMYYFLKCKEIVPEFEDALRADHAERQKLAEAEKEKVEKLEELLNKNKDNIVEYTGPELKELVETEFPIAN